VTSFSLVAAAAGWGALSVPLALESRQLDQARAARRRGSRLTNREAGTNTLDV